MSTKQNNIIWQDNIEILSLFFWKKGILCGLLQWSLNNKMVIIGLNLPLSAPNKKWPGYWQEGVWDTHKGQHRTHTCMQLCKGVEQRWGVRWKCTHVHILTKVWYQKREDWDMPAGSYRGTHVCMQLCKGGGAEVGSQVDVHTCTNACTYSSQVVRLEEGRLGHAHRPYKSMFAWNCAKGGESGGHACVYWCMYTL